MKDPTSSLDGHAESLLAKVRAFADSLDDDERQMFAALIGPGVEALSAGAEVEGFGQESRWEPGSIRSRLANAVEDSEWQIVERR